MNEWVGMERKGSLRRAARQGHRPRLHRACVAKTGRIGKVCRAKLPIDPITPILTAGKE